MTAQRCFVAILGIPEHPVPVGTNRGRRGATCASEPRRARKPPRPRRPSQKTFKAFYEPWLPPMSDAWNPEKVSLRESESWGLREPDWDVGRPKVRFHCESLPRPCPHCKEPVVMTAVPADDDVNVSLDAPSARRPDGAYIACPKCRGRVSYAYLGRAQGADDDEEGDWGWEKYDPIAVSSMSDAGRAHNDIRGLNHCRPCVWASCSMHLYLWVNDVGSIRFNFPELGPEQFEKLTHTCALDVADDNLGRDDRRHLPLEKVGARLGMTLERARQLEKESLETLRQARAETAGIAPDVPMFHVSATALRPRKG